MSSLEEIRKLRIGSFAAFDFVGTIVIFYYIAKYFNIEPIVMIIIGLLTGIGTHMIFKIDTPMTQMAQSFFAVLN